MQHVQSNAEMHTEFCWENLKERDLQGGRDVDGNMGVNIEIDLRELVGVPGDCIALAEEGTMFSFENDQGPMAGLYKGGIEPPGPLKANQLYQLDITDENFFYMYMKSLILCKILYIISSYDLFC